MHMNPNHLLTFAVVARLKSVTGAAKSLHIGQPAVSGQLKLLQDTVGEPLYARKGHRIELTPAGEGLYEYADNLERQLNQASEYVRRLRKVDSGILRIGSTMTIASYFLPSYLVQLQTLHAGVQVYMNTGNSGEIVRRLGELDLGFIEGPVDKYDLPPNYRMLPWKVDEIVLVASHADPLVEAYPDGVPLEVFTDHQVIWRESESGARQVVEQALNNAGIEAPINIEVTGVAGIKAAVRAGLGIGFASLEALRHDGPELVAKRINPPEGLTWRLNIIAPKERMMSRTADVFLDLCMTDGSCSDN